MSDFESFLARFQHKQVVEYPNNVLVSVPNPRVSCWIVAYNQVRYVRQAIDSVLAQNVDFPIEIIIGDDDSNDGTREVLIEYARKHPSLIRLFLHCRENQIPIHGGTANPNFQGIYNWQHCRGEYIATLECDDFWTDPDKLKKQVRFLDENPSYMGVCANFSVVDTEGKLIKAQKYADVVYPDYRFQYALKFHTISRTLACMYRNDSEVKKSIFQLAQAPFLDRIILALMTERGPMHCLPEVMASFRSGSGFFTPHRERIGNHQLVNQWEMLTSHYVGTPFERTSIAVLHHARRKRDNQMSSINRIKYLFRQLFPGSREPHFRFKWDYLIRFLDPVSIPMSLYGVDKKRVPCGFSARFSLDHADVFAVESIKTRVQETELPGLEICVTLQPKLLSFALRTVPEMLFGLGYRFVDIKFGSTSKHIHPIRLLFVKEGSSLEQSLYESTTPNS